MIKTIPLRLFIPAFLFAWTLPLLFSQTESRGLKVATIAPSVSTSVEARAMRSRLGWVEVSPREADVILVVVRSMRFNPLSAN